MDKCCIRCKRTKSLNEFGPRKRGLDKKDTYCRNCRCDISREWRAAHSSSVKNYSEQYRSKNRSLLNERCKRHYHEHKDYYRKKAQDNRRKKREEYQCRERRWRQNDKEKVRTKNKRREAAQRGLKATFTAQDRQRAFTYFDGCCAVCGRPPGLWHILAEDHWIPITKGGPYTANNIVPLCHTAKDGEGGCNNSKHNRDALEWLTEKYGKRKANQIIKRVEMYFDWVKTQEDQ